MKHIYFSISLLLLSLVSFGQGYELGLINNGDYNFSIIAVPDFDGTDTDISDIGFALMLPAGDADVANVSQFSGRVWTATEVTASQLDGLSLGDGTRDAFAMNLPPGQTIISHAANETIVLVSFDVTNMPTSGVIEILTNTDPIAIGLGGAVDSFYNANIDNTSTQDYFAGLVLGLESFMFETLNLQENQLDNDALEVFPNPASNMINVSTTFKIDKVEMFTILGKRVFSNTNSSQINLEPYNSGVYILKFETENGTIVRRVIKE